MDQEPTFSALHLFRTEFLHSSKQTVVTKRQELFRLLNGETFWPISYWPKEFHWGCWNLQTLFIFHWKWLLPTTHHRMDPKLTVLEQLQKGRQVLPANRLHPKNSFCHIRHMVLLRPSPSLMAPPKWRKENNIVIIISKLNQWVIHSNQFFHKIFFFDNFNMLTTPFLLNNNPHASMLIYYCFQGQIDFHHYLLWSTII